MEKRGAKYHRERLGEALREEIETIVEGELGDPRIGLASVSSVMLGSDSRSARIFVVVQGDDEDAERTLEGLTAAVGFIYGDFHTASNVVTIHNHLAFEVTSSTTDCLNQRRCLSATGTGFFLQAINAHNGRSRYR